MDIIIIVTSNNKAFCIWYVINIELIKLIDILQMRECFDNFIDIFVIICLYKREFFGNNSCGLLLWLYREKGL